MFKNFLKTALRNMWRYKGFSLINIIGLAIAITGCLAIGLFINDELKYDKFIKDGDRIYRVYNERTDNIGTSKLACVPPMFATYTKQQYPEVENSFRIMMASGKMLFENGNKKVYEENWLITDPAFFDFFPLPVEDGNLKNSLSAPGSVVITSQLAKKYFGQTAAVGKTILIDKTNYKVTAVLKEIPEHFHLSFDFLLPMEASGVGKERMQSWQ